MAAITKRGPYQYQVVIRRKGYRTQTKTFESRAEAEQWGREQESFMDKGTFRDRKVMQKTTLYDALERYVTDITPTKRGQVSERNRIKLLQRHPLALRFMDTLHADDYARYRDARLKEVSGATVRLELALLSHLYTIGLNEWRWPLQHELKGLRKPKPSAPRERRLEGDEEERLFRAIWRPQARASLWLDACVRLALETGMRAGEILSLEWGQVHLGAGALLLDSTKNGDKRTVGLTLTAVALLDGLPRTSRRVIAGFHDTSGLDLAFSKARKAAGIQGLRFHDLRHESASRYAPHMQPQQLAKFLGWKTLQMAMRYYNPSRQELVDMVRRASSSIAAPTAGSTASAIPSSNSCHS